MSTPNHSSDVAGRPRAPRHLRLNLETDGRQARILKYWIVEEPTIATPRPIGPIVYEVSATGWPTWVDSVADPLTDRSAARPGTREHFYYERNKGTFMIRVPLYRNELPDDLRIRVFLATRPLPDDLTKFTDQVRTQKVEGLNLLANIDLATLTKQPEFNRFMKEVKLSARTEPKLDKK